MSSKTMPYRPIHNQSRVEFIRKKFESSFSEENKTGSLQQTKANLPYKPKFLEELRDLNLKKKVVNLKTDKDFEVKDVNRNEGKAFVKRSPAFRKEKLGCAKSLTQIPHQKSPAFIKSKLESEDENAKEKQHKTTKLCVTDFQENFQRSKTDTDLLKYCSNKYSDQGIFQESSLNSTNSNSLAVSQNREIEWNTEADVNISAQYSVVNKRQKQADKKEAVHLSESIRRALRSPLPKGPPPKKPPRTFCHVPHDFIQMNSLSSNIDALSVANAKPLNTTSAVLQADIPNLKSKLEKLEKVIKNHETVASLNKINKPIRDVDKKHDKILRKDETSSVQGMINTNQSCLPISIWLSHNVKNHNFKKLLKAKSEFYFDINKSDFDPFESGKNKEDSIGSVSGEVSVNEASSEAIYDLPCMNKKNSFETFGKCSKFIKETVNANKAEGLHYMCTDVINQAPKHPSFLTNIGPSKSMEDGNPAEDCNLSRLNLCPDEGKEKCKKKVCMSKIDDKKEVVKMKEVSDFLGSPAFEKSIEESELDSLSDPSRRKRNNSAEEIYSQSASEKKIYVSRVSSMLINRVPRWKFKNKSSYAHLFECCMLVGLTLCESKQNVPYIKSVFPPDTKPPPLIESLCFPDASYWPQTSASHHPEEQYYSLVITNENGERKFGYCRRVLPEGGHVCLPLTYCIISQHRAAGFYYKVLEELESKHGSPAVDDFIKQLYESEFPGPGERLKLKEILEEATRTSHPLSDSDQYLYSTLIRRPPDIRLEEKGLTQLFQHLQVPVFLKVFSSLLLERKVLLLSNSLRNLSSCNEALQSILLPFSWQHTYIPVLPMHLVEMCEAPTPYVIGLLKPRNVEKALSNINFEDGILVDLDESKILKCCGDEGSILPLKFIRDLKTSLNLAMNATNSITESIRSVLISDAFIRFFVQVCGNYYKFIISLPSGEKIFQKENFVKSDASNAKEAFLDWFTETAMFNSFIQDRLQGDNEDMLINLFKRRAMEYSEEGLRDSAVLLKNYRVINKKVRTLGYKIKDFTSFNK